MSATPIPSALELPWQADAWARLSRQLAAGRLGHAWLITGPRGLGKRRLAERLARAALCAARDEAGEACGACASCRLFDVGNHPDRVTLEPEAAGKPIKVDAVRGLAHGLTLTPQHGAFRVAIIEPADAMNANAANALLKTLEEPAPQTLLLLVSPRPAALPATIRSRCQGVRIAPPPAETAAAWVAEHTGQTERAPLLLALAGGAPLAALALAEAGALDTRERLFADWQGVGTGEVDPVDAAGRWHKAAAAEVLDWMASWLVDMARLKGAEGPPALRNPDLAGPLRGLANPLHLKGLHSYLTQVLQSRRLADHPLNAQLLMEQVFIGWAQTCGNARGRAK